MLAGRIDMYAVKSVTPAELERYRTDRPLVADLGAVTFLDSIGIGFLIELREYSAYVRLGNISTRTRALLAMAGVDAHFSYDDEPPVGQYGPSADLGQIRAVPDIDATATLRGDL